MFKFKVRTKQTLAARHIECSVSYSVQTEESSGAARTVRRLHLAEFRRERLHIAADKRGIVADSVATTNCDVRIRRDTIKEFASVNRTT